MLGVFIEEQILIKVKLNSDLGLIDNEQDTGTMDDCAVATHQEFSMVRTQTLW
jgi:hypothetical protein